jgi:hypothetical protein
MKLEQILPYVPFSLKSRGFYPDKSIMIRDVNINNVMSYVDGDIDAKIILKPLSDFTIVKYPKVFKRFNINWQQKDDFILKVEDVNNCSYEFIMFLISELFDTRGLIPKYAIDINTINQ